MPWDDNRKYLSKSLSAQLRKSNSIIYTTADMVQTSMQKKCLGIFKSQAC